VIWNGHPLSVYSRVEQTWVDGRRYFDYQADRAQRKALEAERRELITMVLEEGADGGEADESAAGEEAPGWLIGYRASELAHDEFCHAQDFGHTHGGHVHANEFRSGE